MAGRGFLGRSSFGSLQSILRLDLLTKPAPIFIKSSAYSLRPFYGNSYLMLTTGFDRTRLRHLLLNKFSAFDALYFSYCALAPKRNAWKIRISSSMLLITDFHECSTLIKSHVNMPFSHDSYDGIPRIFTKTQIAGKVISTSCYHNDVSSIHPWEYASFAIHRMTIWLMK